MKKITILLFSICSFGLLSAQVDKENLSSFNMMSVTYKFSPKWMVLLEGQARAIEDYTNIDYYEVKGGVGYNFLKNHQAFVGVGRYGTYKDIRFSQEEFRLWLQYTFTNRIKSLKLDHRVRAEQRFYYYPQEGETDNTQRYRYRLSTTLPLNNTKVQANTVFANAFQEVFVGPKDVFFKRNRTFAGIGYQFNNSLSSTTGYMFQREFASTGNKNLHYLYFSVNFTIDPSDDDDRDIFVPFVD